MAYLYNNSTKLFSLANGRKLLPKGKIEIQTEEQKKEASKLVLMFSKDISYDVKQAEETINLKAENESLKTQLEKALEQLAENEEKSKTLKSKKAKTFKEGEAIAEEETGVEITNE